MRRLFTLRRAAVLVTTAGVLAAAGVAVAAGSATLNLYQYKADCGFTKTTSFYQEGTVTIARSPKNLMTVAVKLRGAYSYDSYDIYLKTATRKNGGTCDAVWYLGSVDTDASGNGNGVFQYQLTDGEKSYRNFFVRYVGSSDEGDSTVVVLR